MDDLLGFPARPVVESTVAQLEAQAFVDLSAICKFCLSLALSWHRFRRGSTLSLLCHPSFYMPLTLAAGSSVCELQASTARKIGNACVRSLLGGFLSCLDQRVHRTGRWRISSAGARRVEHSRTAFGFDARIADRCVLHGQAGSRSGTCGGRFRAGSVNRSVLPDGPGKALLALDDAAWRVQRLPLYCEHLFARNVHHGPDCADHVTFSGSSAMPGADSLPDCRSPGLVRHPPGPIHRRSGPHPQCKTAGPRRCSVRPSACTNFGRQA